MGGAIIGRVSIARLVRVEILRSLGSRSLLFGNGESHLVPMTTVVCVKGSLLIRSGTCNSVGLAARTRLLERLGRRGVGGGILGNQLGRSVRRKVATCGCLTLVREGSRCCRGRGSGE